MASQSLYRKWRSQTFSDFVGQEHIVRTLKNALDSGNISHAYLFTGPRGTGKTTTARLLAKTLNCTHRKNGEPCNECEQCREITAGNSFNVIEIDAASNRGIDSIRELRDKVMVRPSTGKYKIYILDEAHMLTTEAFNALLKTLEEPPEHAIFVMATTDVHKMLPTVLSRCQRFDFKRFTMRQIMGHLQFVAQQEQVKLESGAAELIARAAAGGMRDALSLLDQAIAYSGQEISLTQVQTMLGVADPRAIQKFITSIAQLDSATGLHLIHELAEAGADLRQINTQVAEYWRAMMLAKAGANIAEILDITEDEIREILQSSQLFALEELTDCARIFAQNDLMQKNQGTPQLGLELALLTSVERHRRTQTQQAGQTVAASPSVTIAPTIPPVQTPRPIIASHSQVTESKETRIEPPTIVKQPASVVNEELIDALPDWNEVPSHINDEENGEPEASLAPSVDSIAAVSPVQQKRVEPIPIRPDVSASPPRESSNGSSLTIAQVKEKWELVKRRIKTKKDGSMIAAVLNDYTLVDVEGTSEQPVVAIRASAKFHYEALQKGDRHKVIEWALKIELGQECCVRLLPPGQSPGQGMTVPLPPPPSLRDMGGRSANIAMPVASQQSAHRERPVSEPSTRSASSRQPTQETRQQQEPTDASASLPVVSTNVGAEVAPLARMNVVRENTTSEVSAAPPIAEPLSETRREVLEKKAKTDPVVQEVMRIFKADIKDIQPK